MNLYQMGTEFAPGLTPEAVLAAYEYGVFPMADELTGEITWYLPDPRTVFPLDAVRISRRLARTLRSSRFEIRVNTAFEEVMRGCAERHDGTWISEEFLHVYSELHRRGWAHSVESWRNGRLAGGLYGVALGGAFFGESMFHRESDASKAAFSALVDRLREREFALLDAQLPSSHLTSMGAVQVPAREYDSLLQGALLLTRRFA